jgi:hypothetical protein
MRLFVSALAAAVVVATFVSFALQPIRDAVCFPFLSATEKIVVGKWRAEMLGGVNVTTIHADHRWTSVGGSCFGDDVPPIVGYWWIDGSDMVFQADQYQFSAYFHPDPHRLAIQKLIDTDREVRSRGPQDK